MSSSNFDYDWLVVGSGFGGSVAGIWPPRSWMATSFSDRMSFGISGKIVYDHALAEPT